jgi:hypothetical protein
MPWPTSSFEVPTSQGAAPQRPLVGAEPDSSRVAVSAHEGTTEPSTGSLPDLARRSSAFLTEALDQLVALEVELRSVVNIVAERPWSEEERHRYRALARRERKAQRRCIAARDWFDDVRARLYQYST